VVAEIFAGLAAQYPGAEIRAARLDDFARPLWAGRHRLPVLTQEIGDSWIHGIASDPTLVRDFRELQRLRLGWLNSGELVPGTLEHDDFSDRLLMLPEHTWGKDLKLFLPDYTHYRKPEFAAARVANEVDPGANPPELSRFVGAPTTGVRRSFSSYEESWAEQRSYLVQAVEALDQTHSQVARGALRALLPQPSEPEGTVLAVGGTHSLGRFEVSFADDGSIASLVGDAGRGSTAGDTHRVGGHLGRPRPSAGRLSICHLRRARLCALVRAVPRGHG